MAELARLMGRSPTLLHYHVKLLAAAGLVRAAGRRAAGRRGEALYAGTAERFAVAGSPGDRVTLAAALRTLGAVLRLAQCEAARALLSGRVVPRGRRRSAFRTCPILIQGKLRRRAASANCFPSTTTRADGNPPAR